LNTRSGLQQRLQSYTTIFKEEDQFISTFSELLDSARSFHRDHLPGHITGSAWIVDEDRSHALLVHHAKLNKWLQPGGHADGDEDVLRVATREAQEETGLTNLALLTSDIFDLDIHPIPARDDFPEHLHYDVRFAFVASRQDKIVISNESHDAQWIRMENVGDLTQRNPSIMRMVKKSILM
jgi:8-oxo-dGTP pyrophosphatase MutT (NUDIX family)